MVMFSSRPPFNDDPKPWRCTSCSDRFVREQVSQTSHATKHQPRPQFDRPQHNPTNPILTKFRDIPEGSREPWRTGFLNAAEHQRFAAWSGDEVEHAVRVLSRIGHSHDVG